MKTLLYLILIFATLLQLGCEKEVAEPADGCDVDFGRFQLLETSLSSVPYFGKNRILFLDSLGNNAKFTVTELNLHQYESRFSISDLENPLDTNFYCFGAETKTFSIENDSLGLRFNVALSSAVSFTEPEVYVADVLNIFNIAFQHSNLSVLLVFSKVVDQRTSPTPFPANEIFPQIEFFGREFLNVEKHIPILIPSKTLMHYNQTEGIVAFRDHSGKLWRFDSME